MIRKRAWGHWRRPWDWSFGFFGRAPQGELIWAVFYCGLGFQLYSMRYELWVHAFGLRCRLEPWWIRYRQIPWLPIPYRLYCDFLYRPFPREISHAPQN